MVISTSFYTSKTKILMKKRVAGKQNNLCDSCEQNTAVVFCFQCNGHLCTQCDQQLHSSKLLARHTRTSDFEPYVCQKHGNYTTVLCAQCQELICTSCIVDGHRDHQIQQLPESFEIVNQEVNQLLQIYNDRLSFLSKVQERLQKQSQGLHNSCDQVVQSIKQNFQIIRQQLEEKETAMLQHVEDFRLQVGNGLQEKETLTDSYANELTQTRRELLQQLEKNMTLNEEKTKNDELLYTQRLSGFVQSYIDNQDRYNQLADENSQINAITKELNQQLSIEKQFCLDFSAVQRFVANIENLYIVIQDLGQREEEINQQTQNQQQSISRSRQPDLQSQELQVQRY